MHFATDAHIFHHNLKSAADSSIAADNTEHKQGHQTDTVPDSIL